MIINASNAHEANDNDNINNHHGDSNHHADDDMNVISHRRMIDDISHQSLS